MLHTLAVTGYRSLKQIVLPLGQLNLITGPNGSGKSSVYRSLRLLADTARGNLIQSLAREGGLQSTLMVLNEPETSLHPDLLPALARIIARYAEQHQIFLVTHAQPLIHELQASDQSAHHRLEKTLGATALAGVDKWDLPTWKWPPR